MKIIFTILLVLGLNLAFAQIRIPYSQSIRTQRLLNPAYNQSGNDISFLGFYRNQWVGMTGSPISQAFNVQLPLARQGLGLGLTFANTKWGFFSQSSFYTSVSYTLFFENFRVSMGIQGGVNSYRIKASEMVSYGTQLDGENYFFPNVGLGCYVNSKYIYGGFSIPEMMSNTGNSKTKLALQNSVETTNMPSFVFVGSSLPITEGIKVLPTILYRYQPSTSSLLDVSTLVSFKDMISTGLGYRTDKTLILYLSLKMKNNIELNYSYDFTLSELNTVSKGSHEISLGFNLPKRKTPIHQIPDL